MWRNNVAKYQIVNSPIVNMNYIYELPMKVRDYECDLQGIVNNANYQHYLEHTRHEFLLSAGVSFAGLHEQGVDPVVAQFYPCHCRILPKLRLCSAIQSECHFPREMTPFW